MSLEPSAALLQAPDRLLELLENPLERLLMLLHHVLLSEALTPPAPLSRARERGAGG